MKNLIEALQIFLKYRNEDYPTHCEHDTLYIMRVERREVSDEDHARLEELGFIWSDGDGGCYLSFHYGSA